MAETVAQYQLLDRLGAGGLGEVFRARDTRLGRTVALHRIEAGAADDAFRTRLMREAGAVSSLSHPFLATLYEAGEDAGRVFVATEYVPGETLTRVIAGQPLHPRRAAEFAAQIADGLAEAHARGFVHRDVRPDNVIITPKGQAKLLELGLSGFTRAGAERAAAAAAVTSGPQTPHGALRYLSPEQALGEPCDARTDIFSLGAVLYAMLTGEPPFCGDTAADLTLAVLQATPVPPSTRHAGVPRELDQIVARALQKSLDRRYQSAAEFAADLRGTAALIEARSGVADDEPFEAPPGRSPARTLVVALVVIAIVVLGGWLLRYAL